MIKRFFFISLCFVLSTIGVLAQNTLKVTGVVTEAETGDPVIGASIVVIGTNLGTTTNIDGRFDLEVPSTAKKLLVSYVGMLSQEVIIKPKLSIVLKGDNQVLDDVIVVAFGKTKKSAFTGSAVQINSEDIAKRQVSNVMAALSGSVPGVNVVSGNNQPGMSPSVSIRGIGSFSASSAPLYVVDGVPYAGDISAINPQDIESTTILKDAASAALYGARGANGVIMIQTKNGTKAKDKIMFNVDIRFGVNQLGVPNYDVITSPKDYATKYFEALYNYNLGVAAYAGEADLAYNAALSQFYFGSNGLGYPVFYNPPGEPFFVANDGSEKIGGIAQPFYMNPNATIGNIYTNRNKSYWLQPDDWRKATFKNNSRQEYNFSVMGKSDKANYFMSAGYLGDNGYLVGSGFERFTGRLRSEFRPFEWLKLGGNVNYTNYTSNNLGDLDSPQGIIGVVSFIAPIYPLYVRDAKGNIIKDQWGRNMYDFGNGSYQGLNRPYSTFANPLAGRELNIQRDNASIVNINGDIDVRLAEGLNTTFNVGYNEDNTYSTGKENPYYGQAAQLGGMITKAFGRQKSINIQNLLTYNKNIGKNHFDALIGHEFYKKSIEGLSGSKDKIFNPDAEELSAAILSPTVSSSKAEYATEGYIGRLLYDYNNQYFFQLSYRRDASSRFAKNHRWGNFGSISGSWLISNEDFMADYRKYINYLKLKLSYGLQGNDNIENFLYTDLYSLSNSNDSFSVQFAQKGNKKITWETSKSWNLGLEFGILKDRLSGNIEVYKREVSDMLFFHTVPLELGYSGYYDNLGSLSNTGIEFTLTGVILKTKDFNWQASINGTYFKNKITSLPEEWASIEGGYRTGSSVYRVGGSRYERAMLKYEGLNEQGKPLYRYYNPETKQFEKTTDFKKINETSPVESHVLYDFAPKMRGGFSTDISYKNFDFSAAFSYSLGGKGVDNVYAELMHGGLQGRNWHKDILKSWTPLNNKSNIPAVNADGNYVPNVMSDRFIVSTNYLAINSISMGYSIPKAWIDNVKYFKSARVYLSGDNLWVFSTRKGYDPRFGGGIGYKAMRTISGGIKLSL